MIRIFSQSISRLVLASLLSSTGVLSGYTNVSAQELNEFTAFDIYLGENNKGIATAKYSSQGDLQFEDPNEVVSLLQVDFAQMVPELIPLFSGVIAKERTLPNVGSLQIDVNSFQVRVLLNEKFFKNKSTSVTSYIVQSNHVGAFKISPRIIISQDALGEEVYSYNLSSSYGIGDFSLLYRESQQHSQDEVYRELDFAKLNYVRKDIVSSVGYLETSSALLAPSQKILGFSIATEQLLLSDSNDMRGSRFELYVPIRSRVNFFKEGQLIDSQILSQGKQEVDTSRFPQGSYFVDVVIEGVGGLDGTKRVYYAKSGYLVPRGNPQLSLDIGRNRTHYKIEDKYHYQLQYRTRLNEVSDLTFASYGNQHDQTYIFGFTGFYRETLLLASTSWGESSSLGLNIGLSGTFLGLNLSADFERSNLISTEQERVYPIDTVVDPTEPLPFMRDTKLVNRERLSLVASKSFDWFDVRYQHITVKEEQKNIQKMNALWSRVSLIENSQDTLYAEVGVQKDIKDEVYFIGLSWQTRRGPFSLTNSAVERFGDFEQKTSVRNGLSYQDMHSRSGLGSRIAVNHQLDWSDSENYSDGFFGEYEYGTRWGDFGIGTSIYKTPFTTTSGRRLSLGTSLIINNKGEFATGPSDLGESTLVVQLENFDEKAETIIFIDGQGTKSVKGTGSVAFLLAPYQAHNVRVAPASKSSLVSYDGHDETVTLFPGHVHFAKFRISKIFIALGRLKDARGNLIRNRKVVTESGIFYVEDDGAFQAELKSGEVARIHDQDLKCEIKLPVVAKIEYYFDFGDVVCR